MLDLGEVLYKILFDSRRGGNVQVDEIVERFDLDIADSYSPESSAVESRVKAVI